METRGNTNLVAGATGQQGGAVARRLLTDGWPVRALTRDLNKPAARALAEAGMELVAGNLDDAPSLARALQGVYGVFSVQTFREEGPVGEERQGKQLADAASAARVQHFVYSSVGGAERQTGIPHFESKWRIEEHVRRLGLPVTILRPVLFMENFQWSRPSILAGRLEQAMRPDKPLQMVAVADIGAFAAMAFRQPERFLGHALELAGDELTMPRAAEVFSRVIGRRVEFVEQPLEDVERRMGADGAAMQRWFNERGYRADIPALRALHPGLLTLEAWLRRTGWAESAS